MTQKLVDDIIENLKEVYDPEIPINVYDLGLIYEVKVDKNNDAYVLMTLTSPTCPTADYLKSMIEEAAATTKGINSVEVELTFEPKWTPDRVSIEAKEELGLSDSKPAENLAIQNIFSNDKLSGNEEKQILCFNCGITQDKKPLISAKFKQEEVYICTSCISKF